MPSVIFSIVPFIIALAGQVASPESDLIQEDEGRRTLGGMQYCTDHLVCHDWRIQRNVLIGQFRLLKPSDRVAETGTYEACRLAFDSVRKQPDFPPIPSTVVVTVHGLGRTRNSMSGIGKYVSENGKYGWINFGYASTRSNITRNAAALRRVLDELATLKREQNDGAESSDEQLPVIEYHFVAHSLGNIILRKVLSDLEQDQQNPPRPAWRMGRIVMLGPPNHGSSMANLMKDSTTFRLIAGSSGTDLGAEWEQMEKRLVTPKCEFAIIAGGRSDTLGYSPLLEGDDDLIVRVDETKLSGAADFAVIRSVHTVIMESAEAQQMTLRFLEEGHLLAADKRQRIP
jgi:hypothetical protein